MRNNNSHFLFISYLHSINRGSYQELLFVPFTLIHTTALLILFYLCNMYKYVINVICNKCNKSFSSLDLIIGGQHCDLDITKYS